MDISNSTPPLGSLGADGPGTAIGRIRALIADGRAQNLEMDALRLAAIAIGRRKPTSLDFALIADAFGVSVDWLITGSEETADDDEPQLYRLSIPATPREIRYFASPYEARRWRDRIRGIGATVHVAQAPASAFIPVSDAELDALAADDPGL